MLSHQKPTACWSNDYHYRTSCTHADLEYAEMYRGMTKTQMDAAIQVTPGGRPEQYAVGGRRQRSTEVSKSYEPWWATIVLNQLTKRSSSD